MLEIRGILEFDPVNVTKKHLAQSSWKRCAMVRFDCDLYAYYAWFLEKRFNLKLNKPLRGTHLTIINDRFESFSDYSKARELFHGKEISVEFDPSLIRSNMKGHWWINADSQDARNIRQIIGLDPNPYFGYHITIGRATHLQLEHSNYITQQCQMFGI
jgi:hypothetical protein